MSKDVDSMELEDRDPKTLSSHLELAWEDVIGEPSTIRSPECAWTVSQQCFSCSRNFCYTSLAVLCAPVSAFCLGITFACLAFEHIWCITPCFRVWRISCAVTRNFVMAFAHAVIMPCTNALGYFWSEIKVRMHSDSEDFEKKEKDILLV